MIISNNANELFYKTIEELYSKENRIEYNNISAEIINANLVLLDPTNNLMNDANGRNMSMRYAIGEMLWYNSTNTSAKSISPFSSFWKKLADENGNVNSNYGHCIREKFGFDQWEMCKHLLLADSNTRKAVIHIKDARNLIINDTKDLNCTIALQFLCRQNKLNLIVTMRSNDVWLGLPYDLFNFTCMQIQMAMELNMDVGTYYHNAGSLHLYKKDEEKIQRILNLSKEK